MVSGFPPAPAAGARLPVGDARTHHATRAESGKPGLRAGRRPRTRPSEARRPGDQSRCAGLAAPAPARGPRREPRSDPGPGHRPAGPAGVHRLRTTGRTPTVALRHAHTTVYLTDEEAVANYAGELKSLLGQALSLADTEEFLANRLRRLSSA
ncbi:Scr1 family TA system antitoxin-like transcriptional regulator [Amycolatopsis sp. NPDC004368]